MGPGPGNDASTGQTSGGGWPGTVARCQVQGAQWATQKHRAEERRTAAAAAATAITAAIEQAQTQTRTRTLACRLKRLGKRGLVAAASRRLGLRLRACATVHDPIATPHQVQPRPIPASQRPSVPASSSSFSFALRLVSLYPPPKAAPGKDVSLLPHSCLPRPQPPLAASVPGPSYHPTLATPQHLLRNHAQSNGHALFNRHADLDANRPPTGLSRSNNCSCPNNSLRSQYLVTPSNTPSRFYHQSASQHSQQLPMLRSTVQRTPAYR
jgi:hypothetical protein